MATLTTQKQYSDINFNFVPNPLTGDLAKVHNVQAVKQAMKTLVLYHFYQKPFHPEIGCSAGRMLFENTNGFTTHRLNRSIEDVIRKYEPRVSLERVHSQFDNSISGYYISIHFHINNIPNEITLDFILQRH